MSCFFNVTQGLVKPMQMAAYYSADKGQGVCSACVSLGTVPFSVFAGAIDTLWGIGGGIGMFLTAFIPERCILRGV